MIMIGGLAMMPEQNVSSAADLYEQDETAWLEQTASLVAQRRFGEIDLEHLCEYLSDIARRDKRDVLSRLVTLITHLLKWDHQPEHRSNSWRGTIRFQRTELKDLLESETLRRHAEDVLAQAYRRAVLQAAAETGLAETVFPAPSALTIEDILTQSD
jgi:Domain of unknown function DUF29